MKSNILRIWSAGACIAIVSLIAASTNAAAQNSELTVQDLRFERAAQIDNFITLGPPNATITPYIIRLPATGPTAAGQFLTVTNATSPFQLGWGAAGTATVELVSSANGNLRRIVSLNEGGIAGAPGLYANDFQGSRDNSSQTASGNYSVLAGGAQNEASGDYSVVLGGDENVASGDYSVLLGGEDNVASGLYAVILGGDDNTASGQYAVIGGGGGNVAGGNYSAILSGHNMTNNGPYSVIGGGHENNLTAAASYSFIGGGLDNVVSGSYAVLGGGETNNVSGSHAIIGGGINNVASGNYSVVGGGATNTASGLYSVVGGGQSNVVSGNYSVIPGGRSMTLSGNNSFAFSGNNTAVTVSSSNAFVIANANLWIANSDNVAREARFYEPNNAVGPFPQAGVNYVAFRAPTATTGGLNNTYTLPAAVGTAGQVLRIASGASTTAATLEWSSVMTVSVATVVVNADNQAITAAQMDRVTFLRLDANGLPADRTVTLANGVASGHRLIIRAVAAGANGVELADAANLQLNGVATLEDGDTITLIWDGGQAVWLELSRSNN